MSPTASFDVFYDEQCEVCQAFASWLRLLDRRGRARCVGLSADALRARGLDARLDECLRDLHVIRHDGREYVGWDAVAALARLFPATWVVGALGSVPPFRALARRLYRWVADHRYAVSKCRGGACRVAQPRVVRERAQGRAFWSCYTLGMLVRSPLVIAAECGALVSNAAGFAATYRRRVELLGGRLSLLFLGGWPADLVPLTFGERFAAVLYDGLLIDPGSPRMRASLARHLRRLPPNAVQAVVATHHHEEHVGNLAWAAAATGAPIVLGDGTARHVRAGHRLPRARRWIIGQPEPLDGAIERLDRSLATRHGRVDVMPAPGHCDDHVVLYDPHAKLLLAGDAFMGRYFATPNADVDSVRWIETLERLCALDVEILVEGHGHVRTLRRDVPDVPGVVIREDPRRSLAEKLAFLRWVREQVVSGLDEGLPVRMIEASCFPWGRRRTWESFVGDELARLVSGGEFSRTELVRSFVRAPGDAGVLPTVFELRSRGPTGAAR